MRKFFSFALILSLLLFFPDGTPAQDHKKPTTMFSFGGTRDKWGFIPPLPTRAEYEWQRKKWNDYGLATYGTTTPLVPAGLVPSGRGDGTYVQAWKPMAPFPTYEVWSKERTETIKRGNENRVKLNAREAKEKYLREHPYNRKDWHHWIDADGDCQDTRTEILIRDNIGTIKWKRDKPCNISSGKWICPYTGKTFFKASEIDIDHIVPLAWAYEHGGYLWSQEKKRDFANDPLNLLAVSAGSIREKRGQGIGPWKPPLKSYWKEYAHRWRTVIAKYGLELNKYLNEEWDLKQLEK